MEMAELDQFLGIFLFVQMLSTQCESLIICNPPNCLETLEFDFTSSFIFYFFQTIIIRPSSLKNLVLRSPRLLLPISISQPLPPISPPTHLRYSNESSGISKLYNRIPGHASCSTQLDLFSAWHKLWSQVGEWR